MTKCEKRARRVLKELEKEFGIGFTEIEKAIIIIAIFKVVILELEAK